MRNWIFWLPMFQAKNKVPPCLVWIQYIFRLYGTRCSKCCHLITQSDWIRRAGDQVFHLACFSCDSCTRQLSTGEEFGLVESRLLCKSHYLEAWETGGCGSDTDGDSCGSTDTTSKKRKSKRNRTTFTDEQIHVLHANFQLDCNPDGQDLERIADISGLIKRVVQVWFQNARARNKNYINKSRGSCYPRNLSTENTLDINIAFSTFYSQTGNLRLSCYVYCTSILHDQNIYICIFLTYLSIFRRRPS